MNELQAKFLAISEENAKNIQDQIASLEIKGEEKSDRTFRVVASTEATDRSGEIIRLNGWDWSNYMKNPVIIANHLYKIENIVGKATTIKAEDGKLIIEGVFSKSNPLGVLLADLYDEGMVKTVSVGFIPKERDANNRSVITKAELLELSFVAVPCNPDALSLDQKELMQKGIDAGILQVKEAKKSELELVKAEIMGELNTIKELLNQVLDGKSKGAEEANLVAKETLQSIVRAGNEGLAMFKKAVR